MVFGVGVVTGIVLSFEFGLGFSAVRTAFCGSFEGHKDNRAFP